MPDLDDAKAISPQPRWVLTQRQATVLGLPFLFLLALVVPFAIMKPDYVSLLWKDPMGIKMSAVSLALLAIGAVIYASGCLLINRHLASQASAGWAIQIAITVLWVVGCCLPPAFVVTVGPAAIQIQKGLFGEAASGDGVR